MAIRNNYPNFMSRWALHKFLVSYGTLITIGLVVDTCLSIKGLVKSKVSLSKLFSVLLGAPLPLKIYSHPSLPLEVL